MMCQIFDMLFTERDAAFGVPFIDPAAGTLLRDSSERKGIAGLLAHFVLMTIRESERRSEESVTPAI